MNKFENYLKDNKRAINKERKKKEFKTKLEQYFFKNVKMFTMGMIELVNNTLFHGLDTLKVRLQAKCMVDDVSLYFKNSVEKKPLISGVTSAAIGSFIAGYCFLFVNEKFLYYFFRKRKDKVTVFDISGRLSWKGKLVLAYILSDVVKITIFLPFEARKQCIQMYHPTSDMNNVRMMFKNMAKAYIPLILRDIIFRIITFGSYLIVLNVEHRPSLKYSLEDIKEYIKLKERNGEKINVSSFMDYSKFDNYSSFQYILLNLVMCTILATIITHPFDVIATKILTQSRAKYGGLIQSYKIILKEEGYRKLFLSGLSPRISFNILSSMTVLLFYDNFIQKVNKYYQN